MVYDTGLEGVGENQTPQNANTKGNLLGAIGMNPDRAVGGQITPNDLPIVEGIQEVQTDTSLNFGNTAPSELMAEKFKIVKGEVILDPVITTDSVTHFKDVIINPASTRDEVKNAALNLLLGMKMKDENGDEKLISTSLKPEDVGEDANSTIAKKLTELAQINPALVSRFESFFQDIKEYHSHKTKNVIMLPGIGVEVKLKGGDIEFVQASHPAYPDGKLDERLDNVVTGLNEIVKKPKDLSAAA